MFFVLSKTLGVFLVPSNLIIGFGALGLDLIFFKTSAHWPVAACLLRRGASDMRLFAAWGAYVAPP